MFKHYLTTALRHFGRNRVTTGVSVLCLALGICCFVVAYSVVRYLQSSEAAFPHSARTYFIAQPSNGVPTITPAPLAKYLRIDFPELTVARATGGMFSLGDGHSLKVGDMLTTTSPVFVDAEFLKIFPLHFIAGDPANALSNPRSVILSEQAALKYFGTTDVVGKYIELNREAAAITGVVAPPPQPSHLSDSPLAIMRFEVLASMAVFDRWAEAQLGRRQDEDRWGNGGVYVTYVQLPSDGSLTMTELNTRLASFAKRRVPQGASQRTFAAQPIASLTSSLGDVFTGSLATLLMGLGGVVLLVACLNYANLATAQATTRAKEVGLRKVLGATRSQLMGQHLFETALLTVAAAVIALLAVAALLVSINASLGIDVATVLARSAVFWIFLLELLAVVSVLAGAYPAFVLARLIPAQTLRSGRAKLGGKKLASALVGVQFAVASLMVIAVFAIYRQNLAVHASFSSPTDQVVVINTGLKSAGISLESFREELLRSPAIDAVSAVRVPPWSPAMSTHRVARTTEGLANSQRARITAVAPDFFAAFDMKLLAGRVFDSRFDAATAEAGRLSSNIVVDRAFVEQLGFKNPADAVGTIAYYPSGDAGPPASARIIGVVETQQMSLIGMGTNANLYSFDAAPGFAVVRLAYRSIPEGLAAIDATWKRLAPDAPLRRVFVDELFERGYRYYDGTRQIFTGIAILAFAIAAMGLIGMAVHVVGNRRHEIGVRKTLGASQQRVLSMLMWDFSKPVLIANFIAWPLAFAVEQGYARVIVDRAPLSLAPYLLGLAITLLIAWAAVGAQAYRASRLHPATVLRNE